MTAQPKNLSLAEDVLSIEWDDGQIVPSPDGLAEKLYLTDKTVHLADMTGNGISDLVHSTVWDFPGSAYRSSIQN